MSHNHSPHNEETNGIKIAFLLNFLFTIIEIIGGLITNSTAILADATHDFGDSFSLGLSWLFTKLSKKKANKKFTYGFGRLSLLAALFNTIILITGAFFILFKTIPRIFNPEPTEANGMAFLAIIGILVNGIATLRLKKGKTMNEKTISLHLLEDVLGWVAILVISIIIHFFTIYILDSLLAIMINVYIFYQAFYTFIETVELFLQSVPSNQDLDNIEVDLEKIDNVKGVHDLHLWSTNGEESIFSAHIKLKNFEEAQYNSTRTRIKNYLESIGIHHTTLEFEDFETICFQCKDHIN